jgi:hypothetical protein
LDGNLQTEQSIIANVDLDIGDKSIITNVEIEGGDKMENGI